MKIIKLFMPILILISTFSFAQKTSNFNINGESFKVPGKWEYINKLKESGQFHFTNKKDKLSLLISANKANRYDFYQSNLNNNELLEKFYIWEKDYWSSSKKFKTETSDIKRNEDYIIWKLLINDSQKENNQVSYLLYAVKNNKLIALNLTNQTDKEIPLTEDDAIKLLEKIYFN